jgi:hypothetical protein
MRLQAAGSPTDGRIVNIDDQQRIIYSLPYTKQKIDGLHLGARLLVPIIQNVGATMKRAPPQHRDPMPQHALMIRSSLCTFLCNVAWNDEDRYGSGGPDEASGCATGCRMFSVIGRPTKTPDFSIKYDM